MSLNRISRRMKMLIVGVELIVCAVVVVVVVRDYRLPPVVLSAYPDANEAGVEITAPLTLTFSRSMREETITPATFALRDGQSRVIPARVSYEDTLHRALLTPLTALLPGTSYEVTVRGGESGMKDRRGHSIAADLVRKFTTGVVAAGSPASGPGGPILLLTSSANGFSEYYAEILRNEGFNEFAVEDVSHLDAAMLQKYDLVLVGEIPVTEAQVRLLTEWVRGGGNLVAMRPDKRMVEGLGLSAADPVPDAAPLHDAYLKFDSSAPAGAGLVRQAIQFHGPADRYALQGATALAFLYSDANTATAYPAVCALKLGRGNVVMFSYDLARSVVYTRQGNPLWSGIDRDGLAPVRSDDLFYGASSSDAQPDWVDPARIAIPQADEQQRLLANIITLTNLEKEPLPHFWYLPRGVKATIVMTGDDHGHGGTVGRFEGYLKRSPSGCSIENWECVRATSNIFVGSILPSQAAAFANDGFEIGLHVYTACTDWPTMTTHEADGSVTRRVIRASADALYTQQLQGFAAEYPNVPSPVSNRTDCITWGDYDTQPQVELSHGIRLDTNYYYWPAKWVRNRPGLFTGSGLPMRFAKRNGRLVDVYQATTQMTDESGQTYPYTVDTLLSNALGSSEYYGVFTVNMHNDWPKSQGADAVITSALSRHVPVVTAAQMLRWLDGRNASVFRDLKWDGGRLGFSIAVGAGGNGLQALLPKSSASGNLVGLTRNGIEVARMTKSIAGLSYVAFPASPGRFVATYR